MLDKEKLFLFQVQHHHSSFNEFRQLYNLHGSEGSHNVCLQNFIIKKAGTLTEIIVATSSLIGFDLTIHYELQKIQIYYNCSISMSDKTRNDFI